MQVIEVLYSQPAGKFFDANFVQPFYWKGRGEVGDDEVRFNELLEEALC